MGKILHVLTALAALILSPQALTAAVEGPVAGTVFNNEPFKVIVIDPGHGGDDKGAVGPSGLEEKTVTLKVALELADKLRKTGLTVLLTRTEDVFVPLWERTAFANRSGADMFISIHANAAASREAGGVETFFLSFESTDDEARRVAAFENSVIGEQARHEAESDDLKDILFDLASTEAHHESSRLAEQVQTSLLSETRKENRGVKQAPFVVLAGAAMPAVLVEVGFISNPGEEKWLSSKKEQARIAGSITRGVLNFGKILSGGNLVEYGKAVKKN